MSVITARQPTRAGRRRAPSLATRLKALGQRACSEADALWRRARFSTFEKAILANSVIILLDTIAGWWITQHNPEAYHYIIDTGFILLAALVGVAVNFALLRAAFAPLRATLTTIRAVESGDLDARVADVGADPDAQALANTFNAMLDRLEAARDETVARELRAQEAERRRLALELHDQMGQSLTALTLHAQVIAQRLAVEPGEAATQVRAQTERLIALAERTLAEAQALSRQLRPAILDDLGLAAALRWLADDAQARLGVSVHTRIRDERGDERRAEGVSARDDARRDDDPDADGARPTSRAPDDVETALFRIAQEALTNAVRHGKARHARIHLRQTADAITLTIGDDGSGFDPNPLAHARQSRLAGGALVVANSSTIESPTRRAAPSSPQGIGLAGMRERARLLGGALTVRSRLGRGCIVKVSVPLRWELEESA